jgi:uncharacterized protein (DUF1778 family)
MTTKTERLEMRLTRELRELLKRAAAITGQTLATFVRTVLGVRAQEIVEERLTTVLSRREQHRFLRILEEEDEPAPALKAAARRFKARRD